MPFNKGFSGNPNGRKKGSANKITSNIRNVLNSFIEANQDNIQPIFDQLEPKDKLKFIVEVLPYITPKFQSIKIEPSQSNFEENPLDILISKGGKIIIGN
jgi:hypothetical protein